MTLETHGGMLRDSLLVTLEEAAFVCAEPVEVPPGDTGPRVVEARLAFEGPASGELVFYASVSLAEQLAANLLGVAADDASAAPRGPEAVAELLNMWCGRVLEGLAGDDAEFRFGVPRVQTCSADAAWARAGAADCRVVLTCDEGGAAVGSLRGTR